MHDVFTGGVIDDQLALPLSRPGRRQWRLWIVSGLCIIFPKYYNCLVIFGSLWFFITIVLYTNCSRNTRLNKFCYRTILCEISWLFTNFHIVNKIIQRKLNFILNQKFHQQNLNLNEPNMYVNITLLRNIPC